MTIDLEGLMTNVNTQRSAVDGAMVAVVGSASVWLEMLHGPAQAAAFWSTVIVALGRFVLFVLDIGARFRSQPKRSRVNTLDQDQSSKS